MKLTRSQRWALGPELRPGISPGLWLDMPFDTPFRQTQGREGIEQLLALSRRKAHRPFNQLLRNHRMVSLLLRRVAHFY